MTPLLATSIALSIGLVANAVSIVRLTRWLARVDQRVLDLEFPLAAKRARDLR